MRLTCLFLGLVVLLITPTTGYASEECKEQFEPHRMYWNKLGFDFHSCSTKHWLILKESGHERSCILLNPSSNLAYWERLEDTLRVLSLMRHARSDSRAHTHRHSGHQQNRVDRAGCNGRGLGHSDGASCNAGLLQADTIDRGI